MSNELAVSMDELELESAELLPSRETLCCWRSASHGGGNTNVLIGQFAQGGNTSANGSILSGIADGNAININVLGF
jgi:hypothetical protein